METTSEIYLSERSEFPFTEDQCQPEANSDPLSSTDKDENTEENLGEENLEEQEEFVPQIPENDTRVVVGSDHRENAKEWWVSVDITDSLGFSSCVGKPGIEKSQKFCFHSNFKVTVLLLIFLVCCFFWFYSTTNMILKRLLFGKNQGHPDLQRLQGSGSNQ